MKAFINLATEKGVRRFVLLSASLLDVGDGPIMAQVSQYIASLGVEWAVLRPSWVMGMAPLSSKLLHLLELHTDDRLMKHLERDSEWLQQQLGQYGPISGDFVTKFAYEEYKTQTVLGHSIMVCPSVSFPSRRNSN
jgi:hypothetical protein